MLLLEPSYQVLPNKPSPLIGIGINIISSQAITPKDIPLTTGEPGNLLYKIKNAIP